MSPPACATMPRGGSANLLKAPTPPGQGITSAKAKVRDGRQPVDGLTTRTSSSRAVRGTMRDWASRLLGTRPCLTSCNRCPAADALLRGRIAALRSEPSRRGWRVHRSGCECSVLKTHGGVPSQLQNRCTQSQWTHKACLGSDRASGQLQVQFGRSKRRVGDSRPPPPKQTAFGDARHGAYRLETRYWANQPAIAPYQPPWEKSWRGNGPSHACINYTAAPSRLQRSSQCSAAFMPTSSKPTALFPSLSAWPAHKESQRCLQTCWDSSNTSYLQFKTTVLVRQ